MKNSHFALLMLVIGVACSPLVYFEYKGEKSQSYSDSIAVARKKDSVLHSRDVIARLDSNKQKKDKVTLDPKH